jgi:hypothetical protein
MPDLFIDLKPDASPQDAFAAMQWLEGSVHDSPSPEPSLVMPIGRVEKSGSRSI